MRLHRFYIQPNTIELRHDFWLQNQALIHQWRKVLRYQAGQHVLLFDGQETERLYEILVLKNDEAHLKLVTDYERQIPQKDVYLLWSLLKKDKNDWVLQKATELGVSHFVPLLTERTEKMGFDVERAGKIIIEAVEQCGRSDIPTVREPMLVGTALDHIGRKIPLMICEQGGSRPEQLSESSFGVVVGPEGGWSDQEKALFKDANLPELGLGQFTLRAETAAVTAAALVME